MALRIREKITAETGLNASAGISYNKFLSKLASDHRKPHGATFVESLPVGKFQGIGPATSAKMNGLGIFTGMKIRNQTLEFMNANFGKSVAYYYWISRGIDDRPVRTNRICKSIGAENTFSADLDVMAAELRPLIDKVWRHCESTGNQGRTVTQGQVLRFRDHHSEPALSRRSCRAGTIWRVWRYPCCRPRYLSRSRFAC